MVKNLLYNQKNEKQKKKTDKTSEMDRFLNHAKQKYSTALNKEKMSY